MAIRTKSIFRPIEEDDGVRVLITRYYPRGVKKDHFDYWFQELSPSANLLQAYKERKYDWQTFKSAFLLELWNNIDSLEKIYTLNSLVKRLMDITLLCYEKEGNPCHRHLIRELVEAPHSLESYLMSKNTNNDKRGQLPSLVSNE
jgi:uncharacterized protein YeaO (DUF488 family)